MVSRSSLLESLKKADVLKEKSLNCQAINNMDIWSNQRKLLNIYEELLIVDLEYALDKKVEQDLWNYCFKNYIAYLQAFAKDHKMSSSGCSTLVQAKLCWFLECASGFYVSLLQQICSVFSLDLPFNRCDGVFGIVEEGDWSERRSHVSRPKKTSCYYICQYCLVHLGDIARYRNQTVQAESFYKQAVSVGPWSGQPYNQLALLGAALPDRLSTVFYYVRSIAVAHPFHNALTNLSNTLAKCINYKSDEVTEGKISASQYENLFLKLIACLHCGRDLSEVQTLLVTLGPALTPLIATQQFTPWKLLQICVISIWIWEGDRSPGRSDSITAESCTSVREAMSEYMSGLLTSLLLPLYTMSSDTLLSYFALPPIKVLLSWAECEVNGMSRMSKPALWRGVCKLLNDLRIANPIPPPHYINDALPEDFDVRGFLPLDKFLQPLNYQGDEMTVCIERKLRAFRLIKQGEWLANSAPFKPVYIRDCQFEPVLITTQSPVSSDVISQPPSKQGVNSSEKEPVRVKVRHNVALQSIMRLSNATNTEEEEVVEERGEGVVWQTLPAPMSMPVPTQHQTTSPSSVVSSDPRWWPPGPTVENVGSWTSSGGTAVPGQANQTSQEGRMYSLFSGGESQPTAATSLTPSILKHQSLWSGPGPSPLERLLQQQKNQRCAIPPDT